MIENTFSTKTRAKALEEIKPKRGDIDLVTWEVNELSYDERLARFKNPGMQSSKGRIPYPDRNVMMIELVMICPAAVPKRLRVPVLEECCRVLADRFGGDWGYHNIQFARIRENRLEFGFIPLIGDQIAASRCFTDKSGVCPLLNLMDRVLQKKFGDEYPAGGIIPTLTEYFSLKYGKSAEGWQAERAPRILMEEEV